jgi:PAS domain S-box-containing protein
LTRVEDEGAGQPGPIPELADALRSPDGALRAFIDRWPDAVFLRRGRELVHANPALLALVGRAREEVVGRDPIDVFVHPSSRAAVLEHRQRAPHDTDLRESQWIRKGGEVVDVEVVGVTVMFEGQPARVCLCRDITERRRMQARLLVAGRMASVGSLAAGIAHEINNPLSSVLSNLHLLEEGAAGARMDPAEQREVMADVREGLERVRRIVDGLRSFTRPDDATRERLELPRVVDTAVALTSSVLRARARVVRTDRGAGAVTVNEAQLVQALVDLLVNAAHAIPPGRPDQHEIGVETRCDGPGRAAVEIRDTGVGLSPEQRVRVFDPFSGSPGGGLGLSLCHSIVTGFGGEISVDSRPGKGSTFTVFLPAAVEE